MNWKYKLKWKHDINGGIEKRTKFKNQGKLQNTIDVRHITIITGIVKNLKLRKICYRYLIRVGFGN